MNERLCRQLVNLRALMPMRETEWGQLQGPCEGCGRFVIGYEMHHRKFRSRGGLWVPSNILLLCKRCHDGATGESLWAQTRGWNLHSWEESTQEPVTLWHTGEPLWLDDEGGFSDTPPKVDKA